MWPTLFKIGSFQVGTFGLMVAIGFFVSYQYLLRKAVAKGYAENKFSTFVVVTLISGLLGAKLMHVWVYFGEIPTHELFFSRSGLVYYGGLIGGFIAALVYCLKEGWSTREIADLVAPAIPIGQFFGRIGCFLNGCCYGKVCQGWYGVRFPRIEDGGMLVGSEPYLHQLNQGLIRLQDAYSLPVFPTQLYSALAALLTFLFLHFFLSRHVSFKGQMGVAYLLIYSTYRFVIEMFRDDPRGTWFGLVSTSQGISILLFATGIVLWILLVRQSKLDTKGRIGD